MSDKHAKLELPAALQEIDLSDFASVEPRDLILNPALVADDTLAAGRAIVYARSGDQPSYDAIGFRAFAASPRKGSSPLQTSAWSAMQRRLTDRQQKDTIIDEILNQQPKLRHRPLALPKSDENYRMSIDRETMQLFRRKTDSSGREIGDRWIFSLTDLPESLLLDTIDSDEPMIAAQQWQVNLQATHWLPFPVLLAEGRFRKFQDIRSRLVRKTGSGSFYCFISHRWLDPSQPDPDALQAQFAAWQLLAYLADAVRVADQRGLQQPRHFNPHFGTAVGPRGAKLAEALIVNVLRYTLDADALSKAAAEALSLESELEDYGVAKASKDTMLKELNRLLADRPTLRGLIEHIYLWYDYSCLPQPPREGADVDLFVKGLEELPAAQIIGRTSIMLDDADDYLSRAWCTLEALVADTFGGATDLIVGSSRPSTVKGVVEDYFEKLLQDRPHVVWRAVLDTEVFGIQSSATCMERLDLDVTDPRDLPFIYERLSGLTAPVKVHIDDSEIVTGVIPLPAFENGTVAVLARQTGRSLSQDKESVRTATLNWSEALSLAEAWHPAEDSAEAIPPFCDLSDTATADRPSCHVAVIGASEGEAILFANWVSRNKSDLESLFSVSVTSISWVASDIAPVGHIAVGTLEAFPVTTNTWVVVTMSMRLQHCQVTGFITESLKWAGIAYATLAIDDHENNIEIPEQTKTPEGIDIQEQIVAINLAKRMPTTHSGGLFQWQIPEELL